MSNLFKRRINIFTGHFGSGKTEIAVNVALYLSRFHEKIAIVDFDIVNPYFRASDLAPELERRNIKVLAPVYAGTNVDLPALPPDMNMLFDTGDFMAVFDVGGDELGAKALSRYRNEILDNDFEFFMVINTGRPMTDSLTKIAAMARAIECASRLRITKLVCNTHLLQHTSSEDLLSGVRLVEQASAELGIPIAFVSGMREVLEKVKDRINAEVFYLDRHIRLPWE